MKAKEKYKELRKQYMHNTYAIHAPNKIVGKDSHVVAPSAGSSPRMMTRLDSGYASAECMTTGNRFTYGPEQFVKFLFKDKQELIDFVNRYLETKIT